ncbi:hypothetical protein ES708_33582 [subsurface metagenome]
MTTDEEADDVGKWPTDLIAYLCIVGVEGLIWFPLAVDIPETTWPEFCRQN